MSRICHAPPLNLKPFMFGRLNLVETWNLEIFRPNHELSLLGRRNCKFANPEFSIFDDPNLEFSNFKSDYLAVQILNFQILNSYILGTGKSQISKS